MLNLIFLQKDHVKEKVNQSFLFLRLPRLCCSAYISFTYWKLRNFREILGRIFFFCDWWLHFSARFMDRLICHMVVLEFTYCLHQNPFLTCDIWGSATISVFWNLTQCSSVHRYQRLEEPAAPIFKVCEEAVSPSKTLLLICHTTQHHIPESCMICILLWIVH